MDQRASPRRPRARRSSGRARSVLRWVARGGAGFVLLLLALPALVLVALRFEGVRATVATQVNGVLASLFRGELEIRRLEQVDLGGVRASGTIRDPAGHSVVRFEGLTARLSVPSLVWELVRGGGLPSAIVIDEVEIEHADVALRDDGHGVPTIATTFDPRTPSTTPSSGPSPRVELRRIHVKHAWVHGALASAPAIDADLAKLKASLGLDDKAFQLDVSGLELRSRLQPYSLDPAGSVSAKLFLPLGDKPLRVNGAFHGVAAGTRAEALAVLHGDELTADVTLPAVTQGTLARFAPELALRGPARVTLRATGRLDELALVGLVEGDVGRVDVKGKLRPAEPLRLDATVGVTGFDASALVPGAPASRVSADATLGLVVTSGRVEGQYELDVPSAEVAGETTPPLRTRGSLRAEGERFDLEGHADVLEPGAATEVSYRVESRGASGTLTLETKTTLADPARLVRLSGVKTRGLVDTRARLHWPNTSVQASASARLAGVTHPAASLGRTALRAEVEGRVESLTIRAILEGKSLRAQGRTFEQVKAEFDGSLERAEVRLRLDTPERQHLAIRTELELGKTPFTLEQTTLEYRDADDAILASAQRVSLGDGRVAVERFVLDGAGHASASFNLGPGELHVRGSTRELDLARLARVASVSIPLRSGRASVELTYDAVRGERSGQVRGTVSDIAYDGVSGGYATLDLEVARGEASGMIEVQLARGSRLAVGIDELELGSLTRAPLSPNGRVRISGKFELGSADALMASTSGFPFESAQGTLDLDATYAKTAGDSLPEVAVRVQTHDLVLSPRREQRSEVDSPSEAIEVSAPAYRGVDVSLDLALDQRTRQLLLRGGAHAKGKDLLLVEMSTEALTPGDLGAVSARLAEQRFTARATMPARRLAELPPSVRPQSIRGLASGELTFSGSLADPHVTLDARIARLAAAAERVRGIRKAKLDVLAHAEYQKRDGKLELIAERRGRRAADVSVAWSGDALRAALEPEQRKLLEMHADLTLDELDLESLAPLKNRQVEGIVTGSARIDYGPKRRGVSARLSAKPLRLGQATINELSIEAQTSTNDVKASVRARGESGSLDVKLAAGLTWPAGGIPQVSGSADASLEAKQFRLATLWPVLGSSLNEIDGRLDAQLSAQVKGADVALRGHGRVTEGVVQFPAIGQRFDHISADIAVEPATIVLRDVRARGVTGGLLASARLEVNEHLGIRRLAARVDIPKNQKLPITVQGVAMGDAWGKVEATVTTHEDRTEVLVKVPELSLDVPDTSGNDVQDLARDERVRVGVHRADASFVALPVQPLEAASTSSTPTELTVELGNVRVRRGDQVNAVVTGKIRVHAGEETDVRGRIDVKSGSLDVSGKRFEIERGAVTFTGGDPSNPTVSAQARYEAPGYVVYATYTGTAKKGSLTLRAEPPLSQNEILNLILYGSPEGSVSSGGGDSAATAVGVAGGTAARGLNRAVSDLTKLDIQARVDTSSGDPRPEVVVPVTQRLSARLSRAIGEPAPGTSPDRTFVTLELRLKRNWALSAMFGDRGASALDLVWRRHY